MTLNSKNEAGFAQRVRSAAAELSAAGVEITVEELGERARIQTHQEKKRLWGTIRDFCRAGEMERMEQRGTYRYIGKKDSGPKKATVMWRMLRMQRVSSADDLAAVAGASLDYAKEWLRSLVGKGIVRKRPDGMFVMVEHKPEQLEPPKDDAKAEKLRELRRKQKERVVEALVHVQENLWEMFGKMEVLVASVKAYGEDE